MTNILYFYEPFNNETQGEDTLQMSRDQPVRMVLVGGMGVGKSSLALRFAKGNHLENNETTIGAAFLTHKIQLDAETFVKLEIWDTAGQER